MSEVSVSSESNTHASLEESEYSGFSKYLPSWRPTSSSLFSQTENRLFKYVSTKIDSFYVKLGTSRIWTISTRPIEAQKKRLPLVLLHGMGAGVGIWVQNIDALSKDRQLIACDMLGFGRSSRPDFPPGVQGVESAYVDSIEEWRSEVGVDKMILLGHSLGGYLATAYTLKYPERVSHLILADPWGFAERPDSIAPLPMKWKVVLGILKPFNPFSGLRAAGPLGPKLVNKIRPDLKKKFSGHVKDEDAIVDYIYHCNAQHPSGEAAFTQLHLDRGYAVSPMVPRIHTLDPKVPITMIFGAQSWMDPSSGIRVEEIRQGMAPVNVELILKAGHHVYADDPEEFNTLVNQACNMYDSEDVKEEIVWS